MSDLNDAQRRIAEQLEGMIVVDAGPGTGKTKTVVERYLNIIRSGVDPEDVVLLTFTKNAAGEMEDRIKAGLHREGMEDKDLNMRVGTFDSFCRTALMESPDAVSGFLGIREKLTRGAVLVENDTLNRAYFSDFMDRFLADRAEDYGDDAIVASQNHGGMYDLIGKLMARGIIPLRDGWFGADADRALTGDTDALTAELSRLAADEEQADRIRKALEKEGMPTPAGLSVAGIPDRLVDAAVHEDRTMLLKLVHDVYHGFIARSVADDRLTFGLTAVLAFVALYGNDRTRERLRCRYLMVDEFQDTNGSQLMISLMLLSEPNLCVVGDWKQGIYGFRYVSTDNILRFHERSRELTRFLNDDRERVPFAVEDRPKLPLDINYRSSQLVIDTAFAALGIPGTADEEVSVDGITGIRAHRTCLDRHTAAECVRTSSHEEEVREVLRRIERYVNDARYAVVEDGGGTRPAGYGDIAVLCRTTALAREVAMAAEAAGIPAYLQGDIDVMGSREGKLLLAWLRYVNNERDLWGLCTILADRGCTLAEMRRMTGPGASCPPPADVTALRRELLGRKRRITGLIAGVFDHYGLNNDVAHTILSVVSAAHRGSLLTVSDIITMIEEDMERGTAYSVEMPLDRHAVTVQTMHKSKGLEYPAVIAAGFNRGSFPNLRGDTSVYVFDDLTGIRCRRLVHRAEAGGAVMVPSWKTALVQAALPRDYSEERRLMFVALSRAKQYLTVTCRDPSPFYKGLEAVMECTAPGEGPVAAAASAAAAETAPRPVIGPYARRRRNIGVHDILVFDGEEAPAAGADQVCGKGMEYGTRVHEAAELLARGLRPGGAYAGMPELEAVAEVLGSVSGAVYVEPELDCALPFNDLGVTLRGVIDLYAEFADRIEIHDYKTDVSDRFEGEYMLQLSVYAHAASAAAGKPARCVIDYVSRGVRREFAPLDIGIVRDRLVNSPIYMDK